MGEHELKGMKEYFKMEWPQYKELNKKENDKSST